MKLAWATDLHLDHADNSDQETFFGSILELDPDALVVSGDIAEAPTVIDALTRVAFRLARPVHFVLGNHDYYRGSIAGVRARVGKFARGSRWLRWLSQEGVVPLGARTALVGHDGWGDARLGRGTQSPVLLNDFVLIEELSRLSRLELATRLAALGDEAAEHFARVVPEALDGFEHVVVVTHVPPFREAAWYDGRLSDDDWLPYFSCKVAGDVLRAAMLGRPDRRMTVLCGHTHGAGEAQVLPNLRVLTGRAEYGLPELARVIEVD